MKIVIVKAGETLRREGPGVTQEETGKCGSPKSFGSFFLVL